MRRVLFAPAVSTTTAAALLPMAAASTGSAAAMTTAFTLAAVLPEISVLGAATLAALAALATLATLATLAMLTGRLALPFPAAAATTTTTLLVPRLRSTISDLILCRCVRLTAAALGVRIAPGLGIRRSVATLITAALWTVSIWGTVAALRTVKGTLIAVIPTIFAPGWLILAVCLAIRTLLAPTLGRGGGFSRSGRLKMGTFRFSSPLFTWRRGRRRSWRLLSKLANGSGRARGRGNIGEFRLFDLRTSRFPALGARSGFGGLFLDGLRGARSGGTGARAACFLGVSRFRSAGGRRRIVVVFRREGHV